MLFYGPFIISGSDPYQNLSTRSRNYHGLDIGEADKFMQLSFKLFHLFRKLTHLFLARRPLVDFQRKDRRIVFH